MITYNRVTSNSFPSLEAVCASRHQFHDRFLGSDHRANGHCDFAFHDHHVAVQQVIVGGLVFLGTSSFRMSSLTLWSEASSSP
jgi:hypothetical protein